jgi:hypothetical protein
MRAVALNTAWHHLILLERWLYSISSRKFGSFFLDNFLTSLDNTGSTVYKTISLVYGRILSGL